MNVMLKLISGETIVCSMVSEVDRGLLIRYPFKVNVITESTDTGVRSTMYYSEWILGSVSTPILLRDSHIVALTLPSKETEEDYATALAKKDKSESADPNGFNWDALDYHAPDDPSYN